MCIIISLACALIQIVHAVYRYCLFVQYGSIPNMNHMAEYYLHLSSHELWPVGAAAALTGLFMLPLIRRHVSRLYTVQAIKVVLLLLLAANILAAACFRYMVSEAIVVSYDTWADHFGA